MTGIRMSIRHTSGRMPRAQRDRLCAVRGLADDLDVGLRVEDHAQPRAHEVLVVGDEHAHVHAVHPVAREHRGDGPAAARPRPASQVPPSRAARSCMPVMP